MSSTLRTRAPLWVGPIAFAAVMLAVVGMFNLVSGLVGIFSDSVFVAAPNGVLVLNVTGWGWVHLLFGVMLVATGIGVLLGQLWAQFAAIALVLINMVTQLLLMPAYPFWSLAIIALEVVVVWALFMHGDEVST